MSLCHAILRWITPQSPLLLYAAAWTALLTATVAIASFAPELAFVSVISPSSSFSQKCGDATTVVGVPSDLTGAVICLPVELFARSEMDLIVPPLFAAVVVAGSAFVVRAMGLWEDDAQTR